MHQSISRGVDVNTKNIMQSSSDQTNKKNSTHENISLENALHSKEDLLNDTPPKMLTQISCSLVVAMAHMGNGASSGFSGVTLPQLTQPNSQDIYLTPSNVALFGSVTQLGIAFGGLLCGPFVAKFGHCKILKISLPIILGFWLCLTFTSSPIFLVCSRAFIGFMSGGIYSTSTAYVLEIAHKESRGFLFSVTPVIRHSGFLFAYVLGSTSLTWRQMALVCGTITTIPPFIGLFFFPESPRWLLARGRADESLKSLKFFRGEQYDCISEFNAIKQELDHNNNETDIKNQIQQLLQKPIRQTFLMLGFLNFISNFNGSFAITTFLVTIFEATSINVDPYTTAIMVGVIRVIGVIVHVILIDRLGRRPLHLSTYFIMSVTVSVIGGYWYFGDNHWVTKNLYYLPLASLLIYTFFMGLGQPVLMMMLGELLPTNVRAIGVSVLIFITFLGSFLVTQLYFIMTDAMGVHGTFWTYGVVSFIIFLISLFYLPETRRLSLEEINDKGNFKNPIKIST